MAAGAAEAAGRSKKQATDLAARILAASSLAGFSSARASKDAGARAQQAFIRAENEDDDGYDPYSDRPASASTWEEDPWA